MQWLGGRVLYSEIEGLWVRVPPEALRCVYEQYTLSSAQTAKKQPSLNDSNFVDGDVKNQIKIKQFGSRSDPTVCKSYQQATIVGEELDRKG